MFRKTFLQLTCAAVTAMFIPGAIAAPTLELRTGQTTVEFSPEFLAALSSLKVSALPAGPGVVRTRNNKVTAVFPVTSGSVDSGLLKLEILHSGGLSLLAGTTRVNLSQFNIENVSNGALRIRGIVSANDSIVGELSLFDLSLTESPSVRPFNFVRNDIGLGGSVRISNVRIALSADAAKALNGAFNVTAFAAGFNVGVANVDAFVDERLNLL